MNVECSSCHAKYGVPDDKVRGKKVRITCKRCSSPIIIDGTTLDATAPRPQRKGTIVGGLQAPVFPSAAAEPKHDPWTVAVSEEDQREMTAAQVADAYIAGTIDAETFIWREGMDDWLGAFEIPEIAKALAAKGVHAPAGDDAAPEAEAEQAPKSTGAWREPGKWDAPKAGSADPTPDVPRADMFDDVTVAMAAPKAQALLDEVARDDEVGEPPLPVAEEAPPPPPPEDEPAPPLEDEPPPHPDEEPPPPPDEEGATDDAPAAAEGDLFGDGDDDEATVVADSIRFQLAPSDDDEPRGPGPAAGKAPEPPAAATPPAVDLFGDIDAAGSETGGDQGGMFGSSTDTNEQGGMFGSEDAAGHEGGAEAQALTGARNETSVLFTLDALTKGPKPGAPKADDKVTADMLLAPSPAPRISDDEPPPSIANIGAGGMFSPMAGAPDVTAEAPPSLPPPGSQQAMMDSLAAPPKSGGKTGLIVLLGVLAAAAAGGGLYLMGQKSAEGGADPAPESPAVAAAPAPAPAPAPEPEASAAPSASAAPEAAESSEPAAPETPPGEAAQPGAAQAAGQTAPTGQPTAQAPAPAAPTPAPAPKAEEKPKEEAAPAAGAPFNKSAASTALAAAAVNAAGSCAAPEGKSGSGRVSVTFVNSGRATRTVVTGDLAGTAAGGCVARIFRGAQVPAFAGDAVRVTKSVSLK